jgi:8-oxo-dGTP diphosphatase
MRRANFIYCPYCATPLEVQEIYRQARPACPKCRFVHFLDPKVAVIGLVTKADRVLLIRRAVDPAKGKWALPGGYMDAGEMPETALQRELREEVGLEVTVGALLTIFPMVVDANPSQGIVLAYHSTLALPTTGDPVTLVCDDDVSEAAWFDTTDLPSDLAFESTRTLLAQWGEQKK